LLIYSLVLQLLLLPASPASAQTWQSVKSRAQEITHSAAGAYQPLNAPVAPQPLAVPTIEVTKRDAFTDSDGDGKAELGETITYTVNIKNNGLVDALGVTFNDVIDANTTLTSGVSISPIALNDLYSVLGNVQLNGTDVRSNDSLFGASISGFGSTTPNANSTVPNGTNSITTANGGTVVLSADGTFTYNPPAGYEGADEFYYTLTNPTGSDVGKVSLNIGGMVWFVNASASCPCDGRLTGPFNTLASFQAVNDGAGNHPADNDNIFLYSGNYTGPVTLRTGQKLIGQGASASLATIANVTVPAGSSALPTTGGGSPAITSSSNAINLGSNNTIRGLNIGNTTGTDIAGTSFGTLNLSEATLNGNGRALQLTTGTLNASLAGLESLNSGTEGVRLENIAATSTLTVSGTTNIQTPTGTGISFVSPNNITANFGTTVVNKSASGTGVDITNSGTTTFSNLKLTASNGSGLLSSGGTMTVSNSTSDSFLTATNGPALSVSSSAISMGFLTISSTNSTATGISLSTATGTGLTSGTTTISGPVGIGLNVASSSAPVSLGITHITSSANPGSANTGVSLTSNTGAITFTDLDITPKAGQRALLATSNTGALTNTSGTISASGNVAVEISGTSAASKTPLNMTFDSITASGSSNGILVSNTSGTSSDTAGGFTVTGTGTTAGTGGTISSMTAHGASFTTASRVTLKNMNFTNAATTNGASCGSLLSLGNGGCNAPVHLSGVTNVTLDKLAISGSVQQGINGLNVTNLDLKNSTITGVGDATDDNGINMANLLGTSFITNTSVTGSYYNNAKIQNVSGTLTKLTVSGSTFSGALHNSGFQFPMNTSAVATIEITGSCTFSNNFSGGFNSDASDDATTVVKVNNSTFSGNNDGIQISANQTTDVKFNVSSNTFTNHVSAGINIFGANTSASSCILQGIINSNNITQPANVLPYGPADSIIVNSTGSGNATVGVTNNTINYNNDQRAIYISSGAGNPGGKLAVTVTGNTMNMNGANPVRAMTIEAGTLSTDTRDLCLTINTNTMNRDAAATTAGVGSVKVFQKVNCDFNINGISPSPSTTTTQVNSYIQGQNPGFPAGTVSTQASTVGSGGTFQCNYFAENCATAPVVRLDTQSFGGYELAQVNNASPSVVRVSSSSNALTNHAAGQPAQKTARAFAQPAATQPTVKSSQQQALDKPSAKQPAAKATANHGSSLKAQVKPNVHAALAPLVSPFPVSIGTLPAGKTVKLVFTVAVNDLATYAPPLSSVSNSGSASGTISGVGFSAVTDDPDTGTANDPTVTPVDVIFVSVNRVSVAEGAVGQRNANFNVTLSAPSLTPITMDYATADNPPGAGAATASAIGSPGTGDYEPLATTQLAIPANTTTGTITVKVNGDTIREGNETFLLNLSNLAGATLILLNSQVVGTINDDESVLGDFDGDGKTDAAQWIPVTSGNWYILKSSDGTVQLQYDWGRPAGDIGVAGDYDGDNKTDMAVYRPSEANWYIINSSTYTVTRVNWGATGDIPVPADYDGDGKTDVAVYRPSEANWYIIRSSDGVAIHPNWGASGDIPVPGDYDGDGKTDLAQFRPSERNWYVLQSSNGVAMHKTWGAAGDKLIQGDYDGDGKTDFATYRPSEANWYILQSSTGTMRHVSWGASGDVLVPGDYDGDGRTDIAVFRPSEPNWYVLKSNDGTQVFFRQCCWGFGGDMPVPAMYIPGQ
jgi:hypothetical protein